jgi:hypothetical protein
MFQTVILYIHAYTVIIIITIVISIYVLDSRF